MTSRTYLETNVVYYFSSINQYPKAFQFLHVRNNANHNPQKCRWFLLGEPLQSNEQKIIFDKLRSQGYYFVGISSYNSFPFASGDKMIDGKNGMDFFNASGINFINLMGWLNCHNQERLKKHPYPNNLPTIDFVESDLSEVESYYKPNTIKKYDFVYSCQQGEHQRLWRNWTLGFKCLEIMVYKYDLKIVLIGKKDDPYQPPEEAKLLKHPNVITTPFLPSQDFLRFVQESKGLFLPNIYDASPRVGAEALFLNTPVLENKHIVGGWHYINSQTGISFDSPSDGPSDLQNFENALNKFLHNVKHKKFSPRSFMKLNYDPKISSQRLATFLNSLPQPLYYGNQNPISKFISVIIYANDGNDTNEYDDWINSSGVKIINFQKLPEQQNQIIQECESESNKNKHPMFITNKIIRSASIEVMNHYLSLFFDGFSTECNFEILALNGNIKESDSSDYLYMEYGMKINNVCACIINRSIISDFMSQYNLANQINPKEVLIFNHMVGNNLPDSLQQGYQGLSFCALRNIKSDPRLIDSYTYDVAKHGKGIIYEENKETGVWKELKHNKPHGNYKLHTKSENTLILYDEARGLYVKVSKENGMNIFYVSVGKKITEAVFSRYFGLEQKDFDSKWIYDGSNGKNYFIRHKESVWHEFKNDTFWAEFSVEERNEKYLILYDKNRKLYVKLETLRSFVKNKDGDNWGFLSSGYWKKL